MNNVELTLALATAPSSAFAELRERPRFWFPLLVLVLSSAAVGYWFYTVVDIDWFKDALYGNSPDFQKLAPEARAGAMAFVTRTTMTWSALGGTIVGMPIIFLVTALYFFVAAKVTKLPQGFKHWFSFTCWVAMPNLISNIGAAVVLILADSPQISPSLLQPLSLNSLLIHSSMSAPGSAMFESLSIPGVLGWVLAVIGVHVWSQRSWAFSAIFALLPTVIVYAVWSFIAFH